MTLQSTAAIPPLKVEPDGMVREGMPGWMMPLLDTIQDDGAPEDVRVALRQAFAYVDSARARMRTVASLHRQWGPEGKANADACRECADVWPCATVEALLVQADTAPVEG